MDDNNDGQIQQCVQAYDDNLPDDQRIPNAKQTFDELTRRDAARSKRNGATATALQARY